MKIIKVIAVIILTTGCAGEKYRVAWKPIDAIGTDADKHGRWRTNEKKTILLINKLNKHAIDTLYWEEVKNLNWKKILN